MDDEPLHVERLARFAGLLKRWNRTVNLIAPADEADLWVRHIEDSLQLVPLLPPKVGEGVDLGSGAGFPGLILAIVTGIRFTLIEADQRKAAFLREAARIVSAPVRVRAGRIEATPIPPSRLITARAVAPLTLLLPLAAPKLADSGTLLLHQGRNHRAELTRARREWHMRVEESPSRTARGSVILKVSELRRVEPVA